MTYRNPTPTVDIIIELTNRPGRPIVLIERQNEPLVGQFLVGLLTMENLLKQQRDEKQRKRRV